MSMAACPLRQGYSVQASARAMTRINVAGTQLARVASFPSANRR